MTFKDVMMKVWRIMLCGAKDERKTSFEIGSPTDVRRMDVSEGIPGLSELDKKHIREKASNDAIRLLSLQSHPPTQPSSPTHTPTPSNPPSRSPSHPLLNAASSNLPPSLPTPPRQNHTDTSPPAFRMKSMWERTRRLSAGFASHNSSAGYYELDMEKRAEGEDEAVVMLDLDLDLKGKRIDLDSTVSVCSGKSSGGFEVQDTVGGTPPKKLFSGNEVVKSVIKDMDVVDSSDSEVDAAVERKPLVGA